MKKLMLLILVIGMLIVASCGSSGGSSTTGATTATVFKSDGCGCCGIFSQYLDRFHDVDVKTVTDTSSIKNKYNIPANLRSCHTTVVGDYFVEGHIPVEAINKLIDEKPDIAGIAMPGMPSGSPGMPGPKTEVFVIYAVNHDGSSYEFMRI